MFSSIKDVRNVFRRVPESIQVNRSGCYLVNIGKQGNYGQLELDNAQSRLQHGVRSYGYSGYGGPRSEPGHSLLSNWPSKRQASD